MANLQDTINYLAEGLYKADIIDKKTLRNLTEEELPVIHEFTGKEIQQLRKKQSIVKNNAVSDRIQANGGRYH